MARWITASDGVRLRYSYWPVENAKGTVLIFTGRTEYVEKYGRAAGEFTKAGYAVVGIDWRGQGKSDRLTDDRRLGYVETFTDYQLDVAAFMTAVDTLDVPRPFHLLAHSMGGAIGLRALVEGLAVDRVVFSAPMWGIFVPKHLLPVARILPRLALKFGLEKKVVLGLSPESYPLETSLEDNKLTSDAETYAWLQKQAASDPDLALGGATYRWFAEARKETRLFHTMALPALPVLTLVGTREGIVDRKAIHKIAGSWPSCELVVVPDGQHEMIMETPDIRERFFREVFDFLEADDA